MCDIFISLIVLIITAVIVFFACIGVLKFFETPKIPLSTCETLELREIKKELKEITKYMKEKR